MHKPIQCAPIQRGWFMECGIMFLSHALSDWKAPHAADNTGVSTDDYLMMGWGVRASLPTQSPVTTRAVLCFTRLTPAWPYSRGRSRIIEPNGRIWDGEWDNSFGSYGSCYHRRIRNAYITTLIVFDLNRHYSCYQTGELCPYWPLLSPTPVIYALLWITGYRTVPVKNGCFRTTTLKLLQHCN